MKRKLFILGMTGIFPMAYSQVGVNTQAPQATFDVRGKNDTGANGVAVPGAVHSTDGILVPRVTNLTVNGSVNGQLVYLIANAGSFTRGFYYWNGTAWTGFSSAGGDTTDDAWINDVANSMIELGTRSNGSTARAAGTEFVVRDNGTVGIGTSSPSNNYKLDINGKLKIGTAASSSGNDDVATLARDNTTGEVMIVSSSTGNTKSFSYITYNLQNIQGDWVDNYNTKIPVSQYTVVIVGSAYSNSNYSLDNVSGQGDYNPQNVFAFTEGGTWRLSADFPQANSVGGNGNWKLYCLVINNSSIKTLSPVTSNFGGSNQAAAATMPAGL